LTLAVIRVAHKAADRMEDGIPDTWDAAHQRLVAIWLKRAIELCYETGLPAERLEDALLQLSLGLKSYVQPAAGYASGGGR
jgi:hypothetical protein